MCQPVRSQFLAPSALIEGEEFRTIIPLAQIAVEKVGPRAAMQNTTQDGAQTTQDTTQDGLRPPKTPPKMALRPPKNHPRWPQATQDTTQDGSQTTQVTTQDNRPGLQNIYQKPTKLPTK